MSTGNREIRNTSTPINAEMVTSGRVSRGRLVMPSRSARVERSGVSRSRAAGRRLQAAVVGVALCLSTANAAPPISVRPRQMDNWFAYIPPQCYTNTQGEDGRVHNPCFTCHTRGQAPNFIDDSDLQLAYRFPEGALRNPWLNLFAPPGPATGRFSDEQILRYVREDNYLGADGAPRLAASLRGELPAEWDINQNGSWDGFLPDVYYRLDDQGFDHAPDGTLTGWRAYAYAPFPGTFWPANGSAGDVFIRLAKPFRQSRAKQVDRDIYRVNLAIVEATIRREDVSIDAVDERALGVDLDRDGQLGKTRVVAFVSDGEPMKYVGLAGVLQVQERVHLAPGLFPEFTEFFHSLRYLDVGPTGQVRMSPRFKEVRYAIKRRWYTPRELSRFAAEELKEKEYTPNRPRWARGNAEFGVSNSQGWTYQGFIEDARGDLRPQSYAETVFCVGCHSGLGATTDGNFSFPRKLNGQREPRGWYHWLQRPGAPLPEPVLADGKGEYSHYLVQNRAGDEYRANTEIIERFFAGGREESILDADASARLRKDARILLFPSAQRALDLNRAYKRVVDSQSFEHGRDAVIEPMRNVHRQVERGQSTGVMLPVVPAHSEK
jgi:hypothetical protein